MRTINIDDFPEPLARAVEQMVENLRQQLKSKPTPPKRVKLPTWPGNVIGALTREEIYSSGGKVPGTSQALQDSPGGVPGCRQPLPMGDT